MRVVIPIPGDWPVEATASGWLFAVPAQAPQDPSRTRLFASRLRPMPPIFTAAWAERQLARDVPAGSRLVICESSDRTSAHGWPLMLSRCEVHADDGSVSVSEHRIVLAYRFIYHFGTAELRTDRRPDSVEHLLDLLLAASPDFSGEVACLAQLYGFAPMTG